MVGIEIREEIEAEWIVSWQANPAVRPGMEGVPDEAVIALTIRTKAPDDTVTEHRFAIPLAVGAATLDSLSAAHREALQLAEELG